MQRNRAGLLALRDPLLPAYLAIGATGLYITSFGPSLGTAAADLGVSKATASLLLTALFLGSISASAAVAWRLHGHNQRRLGAIGSVSLVVGALVMGASPWWPLALVGGLVIGFGDGLLVTASHVLVAESSPNVPRDMSRLNLSFAFGAMAGPLWTGFALETWSSRLVVYAVLAAITLPLAWLLGRAPAERHAHAAAPRARASQSRLRSSRAAAGRGAAALHRLGSGSRRLGRLVFRRELRLGLDDRGCDHVGLLDGARARAPGLCQPPGARDEPLERAPRRHRRGRDRDSCAHVRQRKHRAGCRGGVRGGAGIRPGLARDARHRITGPAPARPRNTRSPSPRSAAWSFRSRRGWC